MPNGPTLSSESLSEVCCSRLQDFANQYNYLISIGQEHDANLVAKEGFLLARAHDNGDPFMVLDDLRRLASRTNPNCS